LVHRQDLNVLETPDARTSDLRFPVVQCSQSNSRSSSHTRFLDATLDPRMNQAPGRAAWFANVSATGQIGSRTDLPHCTSRHYVALGKACERDDAAADRNRDVLMLQAWFPLKFLLDVLLDFIVATHLASCVSALSAFPAQQRAVPLSAYG
jgi:hypothetical protein